MISAPHISRPLFTAAAIQQRVETIANEIARDYGQEDFSVVAILKGGFVFTADLIRALALRSVHPLVDFVSLASYGAQTMSSKQVTLRHELSLPVKGRRILLIDDILDTGLTLQAARQLLVDQGASDIRICVLLDKPSRRQAALSADYTGFQIDNVFVVGYGLDYDHRFRELPYLAVLTETLPP